MMDTAIMLTLAAAWITMAVVLYVAYLLYATLMQSISGSGGDDDVEQIPTFNSITDKTNKQNILKLINRSK